MTFNLEFAIASSFASCDLFKSAFHNGFRSMARVGSCQALLELEAYKRMGSEAILAYQERVAQYYNSIGMPEVSVRLLGLQAHYPAFEKWRKLMMESRPVPGARATQSREDYIRVLSEYLYNKYSMRLGVTEPVFSLNDSGEVFYECLRTKDSFSNYLYFCEKRRSKCLQNHSGLMCIIQTRQLAEQQDYDMLADEVNNGIILLKNNFSSLST